MAAPESSPTLDRTALALAIIGFVLINLGVLLRWLTEVATSVTLIPVGVGALLCLAALLRLRREDKREVS